MIRSGTLRHDDPHTSIQGIDFHCELRRWIRMNVDESMDHCFEGLEGLVSLQCPKERSFDRVESSEWNAMVEKSFIICKDVWGSQEVLNMLPGVQNGPLFHCLGLGSICLQLSTLKDETQ